MSSADVVVGGGSPPRTGPTGLPLLQPLEVAVGCPLGTTGWSPRTEGAVADPVNALRDVLRQALQRPPCVVTFSGGRDSSLLLSMAADLAAREGLDPPIALTLRYPGDPDAEESQWQELVMEHIDGLGSRPQWVCRDITDELDVIGEPTAQILRAHGAPVFPAALGNMVIAGRAASGGSLVTGDFGDDVVADHRMSALRSLARRRARGLSRAEWELVLSCAVPDRVARWWWGGPRRSPTPWLHGWVRDAAMARVPPRPLRWDRAVRSALAVRAVEVSDHTRQAVLDRYDCHLVQPFATAAFRSAYAAFGGRFGGLTRTGGIRMLSDGLLPESVIRRGSKAFFNASRFGPVSREFAREWDGRGLDETMVHPERLREAWLAEIPPGSTALLLQQAWLTRERATS